MDNSRQKAFVVFNPTAGKEDEAAELPSALARHFTSPRWTVELYETTGKEDVTALIQKKSGKIPGILSAAPLHHWW